MAAHIPVKSILSEKVTKITVSFSDCYKVLELHSPTVSLTVDLEIKFEFKRENFLSTQPRILFQRSRKKFTLLLIMLGRRNVIKHLLYTIMIKHQLWIFTSMNHSLLLLKLLRSYTKLFRHPVQC